MLEAVLEALRRLRWLKAERMMTRTTKVDWRRMAAGEAKLKMAAVMATAMVKLTRVTSEVALVMRNG